MLTVKDLFEIQAIDGLKIVAGEHGINNEISIVNIIENPEAFDWLSPNELLLSTGYIFKDNEDLQIKIINELSAINCAGLVIKMKRYFEKLPQRMIDHANKMGFPLLELPFEYTLSRVISIINEKASGRYDLLNRKTLDMHNLFFRITLEGGGIERISSMLSGSINNPIIFVDEDWKLLHYSEHQNNKVPLSYCFNLVKNRPIFNKDFINSVPKDVSEMKKSIQRIYYLEGMEIKCRILPVAVASNIYGYIVVWQTVQDLTEFDFIILEQASTNMALERIKAKDIEEVKLKIKQDFFDDLLTGKITSVETIHTFSEMHGLNPSYIYYCIVINLESEEHDSYDDMVARKVQLENKSRKCVDLVYSLSNYSNAVVTCFHRNNRIIIMIGQSDNKPPLSVNEVKQYGNKIYNALEKDINNTTFLIGIGRQYETIHSLHKSFSEANESIRLMQKFNTSGGVSHYEDHSIYHFLDSNIKDIELEDFFMKSLGKIYEHDHLHGTSYIITLENYFLKNLNISETAKAMFLHRNTLIYRIEKIKEILNTDLKNSEELLQIQLALKIFRLLNKKLPINS
ncbi:PucR family transcriptional regulator ligand-binding domain-containing protein [Bacillus sp. ISL-40]|uniref:PucR family transcriptional regulator n=1 Tax=unclassified Bacillus (in: firmicutes) TaxID=185979 RepID=UPI001BED2641|nr:MULTISPECIES: PucR family transcriptional regulator [unclassified Bacillus (in: firmicutes)]MBT2699896.1 PucR family transcriptional regulator ligand-binding domain-containing protein [Bacillus sp. ISL-40]MBT2722915.1 PucR family transcriptional regulator ligand-binding domain-containing protein [Bacillus sp. ISL-46]MBT2743799.1 PucR family transcriptional regulator ligand-binding domain-containing protein [Bacillus sp. ISL-77]